MKFTMLRWLSTLSDGKYNCFYAFIADEADNGFEFYLIQNVVINFPFIF